MRIATIVCSFLFPLFVAGCTAKQPTTGDEGLQSLVDATAKANPDVIRLTVHKANASGGGSTVAASTSAEKLGKPSDKEDLQAMETGQTVVLEEKDALDITVPAMQKDGKWTAAIGVTLKAPAGTDKEALKKRASEVASGLEKMVATKK